MRDYERSAEENEEYGLNDINTADFETGYEDEEQTVVLPDRLTHVYEKSADHPTRFATGVPDTTPGGEFRGKDNTSGQIKDPELPQGIQAAKHSHGGIDDDTAWQDDDASDVAPKSDEWIIDYKTYGKRNW